MQNSSLTLATASKAVLITVFDNYLHDTNLETGWGFSCVVKIENKNILFDTGADGSILLNNMGKLGLDPKDMDLVVLSHIHGDHVGGLGEFLEKNVDVTVYFPASFPERFKEALEKFGAKYVDVSSPVKISDCTASTGEMGGMIKEQSLIVKTQKGITVITGCAHPGIVEIAERAKKLTGDKIHLVIGGFHLGGADDSSLLDIIKSLRELGVEKVAPCHCSGERARRLFERQYKSDYISNGVGKIIEI